MRPLIISLLFGTAYAVASLSHSTDLPKKDSNGAYISREAKFTFEVLLQQKDVVWGFDFLTDKQIIFTERGGALRVLDIDSKKVTDISGVPKVWVKGQGGLLDVRISPKKRNIIFLTYSEPVGEKATTAFATAKLDKNKLTNFKKIISAHEASEEEIHFGSRIEFDGKGHVFVTMGERNARTHVQDMSYHRGKVLRFNEDGTVPKDNPLVGKKDAKPEIWSWGHRSNQGLTRHPETGDIYLVEMGPRGGDEVNLIKKGANYGWPDVTYGREYYGPRIGVTEKEGVEKPLVYWVPSISPSGANFYTGTKFINWKNNLFIGTLSGQHLRRIVLDKGKVIAQEELLNDLSFRIRNVRTGPDGALYISTDDGKIARLVVAY